ncbi:MAG: diguanylate cyclase, partial [Clostridia bacterium]
APVVLLLAGLLGLDHRRDREALERDAIGVARAMSHAVDRELVSLRSAAQVLATSQHSRAGDLSTFYAKAKEVVDLKIAANVVLSDSTGQQVLNTIRPFGSPLPKHGNLEQLKQIFAEGGPVISDIYIGGVMKKPVMSIDVPVLIDGKVAYDLSLGELPERFLAVLNEQKLPEGWIGVVIDKHGTVVARTHEHERFVGGKVPQTFLDALAREREGMTELTSLEGTPIFSAYSRSPETGWTVALGIPREQVQARLWERTRTAVGAVVVILAVGLLLAWNIGGSIAASVRGLLVPAARIGRREQIDVHALGLREADEVGEALARASRMLASAEHRAQHDALTGLANRALFTAMVGHQVERAKRARGRFSILFLDLDGFKEVNDRFGHDAGDALLIELAGRLRGALRGSDVAARLGGDEFVVVVEGADHEAASGLADKLHAALDVPYDVGGEKVRCPASIGIATYPEAGATSEEMIRSADEAMYREKTGRGRGGRRMRHA